MSGLWGLNEIVRELKVQGELTEVERPLSEFYEPTKILIEAERTGKTLLFEVAGKHPRCVGNLVGSRQRLYAYLRAENDLDAYRKLISAMSNEEEAGDWFNEYSFTELYRPYEGGHRRLPAVKFYERDGGPYVDSSIIVAKTPELDSYNASIHRLMVIDEGFAVRVVPRHLFRIHEQNRLKNAETPVAIAVGVNPLILLASALSPPYGVFEFSLASRLTGLRVPLVRTPKYGLPVVAGTSVVIEGRITKKLVDEGPFVDLLGLYDAVRKQPLIVIDSIYVFKDDPYFHVILPGGSEHKALMGFPREALIWDSVRRVVPRVVKVRLTESSGQWLNAIVSIERNHEGDGKNAALAAFAGHPSLKHVIVVDDDIDPDDLSDVEWALATRFQASKGLIVISESRGSTLDPSAEEGLTDKVAIVATYPLSSRSRFEKPKVPEGRTCT
ncbi:MAG: UbiD family decarboxylase [Zestosphaera sp.]